MGRFSAVRGYSNCIYWCRSALKNQKSLLTTIVADVFMSKRISVWTFHVLFIRFIQRSISFRTYSHDGSRQHIPAIMASKHESYLGTDIVLLLRGPTLVINSSQSVNTCNDVTPLS